MLYEVITNLGRIYASGSGVVRDDAAAVRWFSLSAEQGFAAAQYGLGVMSYNFV